MKNIENYKVPTLSFFHKLCKAIKGNNYEDARDGIIMAVNEAYSEHRYLLESSELTEGERRCFLRNWIIMQKSGSKRTCIE